MIFAVVASNTDRAVDDLARIAQENLQGEPVRRDEGSFLRIQQKLTQRAVGRRRRAQVGGGLMAALVVVALTAWFGFRDPAITYSVVGAAVVDGDHVVGGKGTALKFSDGSEFALEPGTDARISDVTPRGGRVNLVGSARVAIAKKAGAAWTVAAGPYTVRVTGTAFDVSWSPGEQKFELSMQSGSVVVEGPLIDGGLALKRGQRLSGGLGSQKLVVEDMNSASRPASTGAIGVRSEEPAANAPSGSKAAELGWAKSVAQGNFAEVLAEAEKRGIEHTLATAPLGEIQALADAARYGRRTALARRVLLAERSRFPGSRAAIEAAFFLGRIVEDEGGDAIVWYDRYLSESRSGAYASQALGRKMMLIYGRRGAAQTQKLAEDYLSRYPSGPYASAAKKIIQEKDRSEPIP